MCLCVVRIVGAVCGFRVGRFSEYGASLHGHIAFDARAAAVVNRVYSTPGEVIDGNHEADDPDPFDRQVTVEVDILAWCIVKSVTVPGVPDTPSYWK